MRGESSFVHDDGHLGHYPISAVLNHTEFQFKGLSLGMKLFDKCLTLRESPKLPVLWINNSTRAIIIPKNMMHYTHDDGQLTLLTSHHVAWWSGEGHIDAWKCWRSQYLKPQHRTDVTAPKVVDLPRHYINFGLIRRIPLFVTVRKQWQNYFFTKKN